MESEIPENICDFQQMKIHLRSNGKFEGKARKGVLNQNH